MGHRGVGTLSGVLGSLVVVVAVLAACSDDTEVGSSAGAASSTTGQPAPGPSVTAEVSGPPPTVSPPAVPPAVPPSTAPTPLAASAYPPLSGFGEVHDLGSVVAVSDDTSGGVVLSLDRKAYVHCTPRAGDENCLDGYRIDDVDAGTRSYAVTPTVRVSLTVAPEEYETGDLADLRKFVATHPSSLMILQLDAQGRVTAVGQPWLP